MTTGLPAAAAAPGSPVVVLRSRRPIRGVGMVLVVALTALVKVGLVKVGLVEIGLVGLRVLGVRIAVDDVGTGHLLRDMGNRSVQGFLLAWPIEEPELSARLAGVVALPGGVR